MAVIHLDVSYLLALTPEAQETLPQTPLPLDSLPLRFGRDLRTQRRFRLGPDRRRGFSGGANDIYLPECGPRHRISREHFLLGRDGDRFYIEDRESTCGTLVDGDRLGGARRGGRRYLSHGATIQAGGQNSPWLFRFHDGKMPLVDPSRRGPSSF